MLLTINGAQIINDTTWNNPAIGDWTVPAPGWYSFQLRLGQFGGRVGPNIAGYPYGLGYDPNGAGGATASNYVFPTDPGNGSLFQTNPCTPYNFANAVSVNGNSSLDLAAHSSSTFGPLSIGAGGPHALHVTSGPAYASFAGTTIGNSPVFDVQNENVVDVGGITATDAGGFTLTGNGTLVVSGNSTYSGPMTISGGTLQVRRRRRHGHIGLQPDHEQRRAGLQSQRCRPRVFPEHQRQRRRGRQRQRHGHVFRRECV